MGERQYKNIELKCEEVQEIMNKIPNGFLRYSFGVMVTIVLLIIIGCAFLKYPKTLETEVIITSQFPTIYIKSQHRGRIEKLYASNGALVQKGEILAVIENLANTDDILGLRQNLLNWQAEGAQLEKLGIVFTSNMPRLGNVQEAYLSFLLAWKNYQQYTNEKKSYETELSNATIRLFIALKDWENKFLLISPIDGCISFMQFWEEGQYVNVDDNIFVVVSKNETNYKGKVLIPMQYIGKINIGQRAKINLTNISEKYNGSIEGTVLSISPVPNENDNYVLELGFPNDLEIMNEKKKRLVNVISGKVKFILEDKTLLHRLISI